MNKLQQLVHCDGCTDRPTFVRNVALLTIGKTIIDLGVMHLRPDLHTQWSWALSWLNPFVLVKPWLAGGAPFLTCLTTFCFFAAVVWNSVHRARHAGWPHWSGLFTAVPFVGPVFTLVLAFLPTRKHSVWDLI